MKLRVIGGQRQTLDPSLGRTGRGGVTAMGQVCSEQGLIAPSAGAGANSG